MLKRILSVILICIMSLALISCDGINSQQEGMEQAQEPSEVVVPQPIEGGTLGLCMFNVDTMNPLITKNKANADVLSLFYDGLFGFLGDLAPQFVLCEEMKISEDGQSVSLKIRDGVKFHSGESLTPDDVKFSIMLAKNSGGVYSNQLSQISGVSSLGRTVTLNLAEPVFNIASILTFPIIKKTGSEESAISSSGDYLPNGTGLYKLKDYEVGNSLVLEAFDGHFSTKAPYIKDAVIELVKDRETALKMIENSLLDVLPPTVSALGGYPKNSNISEVYVDGGSLVFLGINNQHPALLSPQLRAAMSKAIDRSQLISGRENLKKTPLPIHPESWLYPEGMKEVSDFAPEEASAAIFSLGWADSDNDSILDQVVIDEPTKLFFDILYNEEKPERAKLAESIKENLERIGIGITLTPLPFYEYTQRIESGYYDLFIGEVQFGDNGDFTSFAASPGNLFGAYSEGLLRLALEAKKAADFTQMKEKWEEVCVEFTNSTPFIPLYFKEDIMVINKRIRGNILASSGNIFMNIYDWFIY